MGNYPIYEPGVAEREAIEWHRQQVCIESLTRFREEQARLLEMETSKTSFEKATDLFAEIKWRLSRACRIIIYGHDEYY